MTRAEVVRLLNSWTEGLDEASRVQDIGELKYRLGWLANDISAFLKVVVSEGIP